MKVVIYKLPTSMDYKRPNFVWGYRCDCGYVGGFSSSRKNAQKGANGHGNRHRPQPPYGSVAIGQSVAVGASDGTARNGTVSVNLHRG